MRKALSYTQPFATLVILGYKLIETRPRRTSHRGELLIHASATRNAWSRAACEQPVIKQILEKHGLTYDNLPRGLILGSSQLREVAKMVATPTPPPAKPPKRPRPAELVLSTVSSLEQALGEYAPGRFGWLLADVQAWEVPVKAKGSLSLWDATGALQVHDAEVATRRRLVLPSPEQQLLLDEANGLLSMLSYDNNRKPRK
jgi:hypothetical protein